MIRCYLLLSLYLLNALSVLAQKMPEDYLLEADRLMHNDDSLAAFNNYAHVVKQYPGSPLCAVAYAGMAKIYDGQGEIDEALAAYRVSIAIAISRNIDVFLKRYQTLYSGYQEACRLYNIYKERKMYDSALYYFSISDTVFFGTGGCDPGSYVEEDRADRAVVYADLYIKLNRFRDAELKLLGNMGTNFRGFPNSHVTAALRELYQKNEKPGELKKELETAINNFVIDTVLENRNGCIDTVIYYKCHFRGLDYGGMYEGRSSGNVEYEGSKDQIGELNRKNIIAYLKKSELYKMIQEL